jgi:Co/Zn/Cd efflux system component
MSRLSSGYCSSYLNLWCPDLLWLTGAGWPDILVGLALSILFLRSAIYVIKGAIAELRTLKV